MSCCPPESTLTRSNGPLLGFNPGLMAPFARLGEGSVSVPFGRYHRTVGLAVGPRGGTRAASPYSAGLLELSGIPWARACAPRCFSSNASLLRAGASSIEGPETVECALVSTADSAPETAGLLVSDLEGFLRVAMGSLCIVELLAGLSGAFGFGIADCPRRSGTGLRLGGSDSVFTSSVYRRCQNSRRPATHQSSRTSRGCGKVRIFSSSICCMP